MKKLKRFVSTILFLSIGLVLTVLTSYTLRPSIAAFFRGRMTGFYAEEEDSLDVIAIGSSSIYRYLDSPYLYAQEGITSYMLATAAQPIFVVDALIDEACKTQNPQLIIVEVRRFATTQEKEVNESFLRMVTDNMKYSLNRLSLINELVSGWQNRLSYYFDIMVYHDNWENFSRESLSYLFNSKENELKGWVANSRTKALTRRDYSDVTEELPISEAAEEELLSIIAKCKEKNVDVLFVATPWRLNKKTQKKNNYIRRIVEENGCLFLDGNLCSDEIGLDYSVDFYNKRHTNAIGARKFTAYLGEYIMEHYDLTLEHSESAVQSWDEAAALEQQVYEQCEERILAAVARREAAN